MSSVTIAADLARAMDELPALQSLVTAFGPVLIARRLCREEAPGWTGPAPAFDAETFCQGLPILAGSGFQEQSAELPRRAKTLLPVLARSFPAQAEAFNALGLALDTGVLTPDALWAAAFGSQAELPGVPAHTLTFAAAELVRPFIERQAQDLLPLLADLPWGQPRCPVCGAAPNMSALRRVQDETEFIQAHGGRRFLRCSCCASQWTAKRVSCPSCGCEEPDDLVVLRDPERPYERADACRRCKSFVLCLDTGEMVAAPDLDVAALTMLPLEIKTAAQGFAPLAGHPWSGL